MERGRDHFADAAADPGRLGGSAATADDPRRLAGLRDGRRAKAVPGAGRSRLELLRYGVTLHEVKTALAESNENATGGYLDEQGPHELLVRSLGRIRTVDQIEKIVVATRADRPVLVGQVARVVEGPQVKRGDSAAFVRDAHGGFSRRPGGIAHDQQAAGTPTRASVTQRDRRRRCATCRPACPTTSGCTPDLYQQQAFIDLAIENVVEALRDGGILVVIVLFLFLLNFRTTFITLTAIPLSIVMTGLVFAGFGLSINTMTLGGLAVAIGELVDDAIVDVENIFRRLQENRQPAGIRDRRCWSSFRRAPRFAIRSSSAR